MPTLREVQATMAAALLAGEAGAEERATALIWEGVERLSIHRNTIESVLIGALGLSFPALERLVGGDFFAQLAMAFARCHPPAGGGFNDWGGELAAFVETYPPAAYVAYLADAAFTRALFEADPIPVAPTADQLALLAEHLACGCFQETSNDDLDQAPDRLA